MKDDRATRRWGGAAIGLLVLIASWAAPPTQAATARDYYYVSRDHEGHVGTPTVGHDAFGHAAANGAFATYVTGPTFTLLVDDFGVADGLSVPVHVSAMEGPVFTGCLAVRSTVRLPTPGSRWVQVAIGAMPVGPYTTFPQRCSGVASAGRATLVGVR